MSGLDTISAIATAETVIRIAGDEERIEVELARALLAMRDDLAAARAEADGLRGLVGEACDELDDRSRGHSGMADVLRGGG